jgi:3D (Asp-Asp-Asp) domain-containing protein
MVLSRSLTRKLAATCGAVLGFVLLYEVTALDSKATARLRFHATAYCKGTTTASGTTVRTGIAAADPLLLPVGSVIQIDSLSPRYNGIYTVMDTGPAVQGREIDIYMCDQRAAPRLEPEGVGAGVDRGQPGRQARRRRPGLPPRLRAGRQPGRQGVGRHGTGHGCSGLDTSVRAGEREGRSSGIGRDGHPGRPGSLASVAVR